MKLALESFEKLIKSLPEPILLITGEGEILAANSPFLRIFKPDRPDLQSKTLFDLALTERAALLTYLNSCSRSRQILFGAIELNHRGTGPRAFRCEGAALEPASETSPALIFLRLNPKESAGSRFQTLTRKIEELNKEIAERLLAEQEKERLYRAAEEANRLKDEFLATVSHELRTPLNAILGWAQMLRSGNLDEATFNNALEVIERNARSQKQLTEDLLDVSRIISGKVRLDIHPTDLLCSINRGRALRPTAKINISWKQSLIRSRNDFADPDAFAGDVELISNAIKFTPKKGRAVRLERAIPISRYRQRHGEAFRPDFLLTFDRFRIRQHSSRQHGGLGLARDCRHLVELHGGSVQAHARNRKRAIFVIMLPILIMRKRQGRRQFFPRRITAAGTFLRRFCSETHESAPAVVDDDGRERNYKTI
jgi:signal transduction histidine kinase